MMTKEFTPVFIHREELDLVWERLSALRAGQPVPEPVLFFHGVPMIGKSTLLYKIRQRAVQNLIPTALVDFSEGFTGTGGKERLAREIMKQWEATADVSPFEPAGLQEELEGIVKKLVDYAWQLHTGARPAPVALLLDTLESADRDVFLWLQEQVLGPLLEGGKAFIALTARAEHFELPVELTWPISRRSKFVPLSAFTTEQSQLHLQKLKEDRTYQPWQVRLFENPNPLTQGVPGLNEIIIRRAFETKEVAVRYLVEEVVFKRIATGQIEEVRDVLLAMAAFRRFDYRSLARIANHFWPKRYPEATRSAGVRLARQLKATTLMEARQDGYGQVISPTLRPLLDDYQRFNDRLSHFETHCLAYRWFRQEVAQGDFVAVADQLYHLGGAWFDWQQDDRKTLTYPEDLPSIAQNRLPILLEIVQSGLKTMLDKSKADSQVDKVRNALRQEKRDFLRFFSDEEMTALLHYFEYALDRAAHIADEHDEIKREPR